MKLVSLSVRNYRSITRAYKLPLSDLSILVGPNNEGKSNILQALALALAHITGQRVVYYRSKYATARLGRRRLDFDWDRDFPVDLQGKKPQGNSEITLELALTEAELEDFRSEVKSNLSTNLKLKFGFGPDSMTYEVLKKGKAKKILTSRFRLIAEFVSRRVDFQYIPSIRTAEMTVNIVEGMLERELARLEEDEHYQNLLNQIQDAQQPILQELSSKLRETVAEFVPDVKSVQLTTRKRLSAAIRSSCEVLVDDGTITDLSLKGDGIKSLVAIALMRHRSQSSAKGRNLILAIEEPESHLHPEAIRRLRDVLAEISASHQVVLTTHSPLLVEREQVRRNIIVAGARATAARSLRDVREALGVAISDNLASAHVMLLVEGPLDVETLLALLKTRSRKVTSALGSGSLVLEALNGAAKLCQRATMCKNVLLCNVCAFVDNDNAGRSAAETAIRDGALSRSEVFYSVCPDMENSELEDLVMPNVYATRLEAAFGVNLQGKLFHNSKKQWSQRLSDCFRRQGKVWSEKVEKEAKQLVATCAIESPKSAVAPERGGAIRALSEYLEERLASA